MSILNTFVLSSLSVFLAAEAVLAATSSRCPGEEGYFYVNYRHRNPTNGGFVSHNAYVDDTDNIFIAPTAAICGSSHISDRAKVYGTAIIDNASISGRAEVFGDARVSDGAEVTDEAKISENAEVSGSVRISGRAVVSGSARVVNASQDNFAEVSDRARVTGNARVTENAQISGSARVQGNAVISGDASISGKAVITGHTKISDGSVSSGTRNDPDYEGIAKAKKADAEAEAARKAAAAHAKQVQQKNEAKTKRFNEIVKELTDDNYLQTDKDNSITFPSLCRMNADYRVITPASAVLGAGDKTYHLKVFFGESVSFHGYESTTGRICVEVDLRGLASGASSERSYYDNYKRTTGYANGAGCLPVRYSSISDAQYVAGLLNEMHQLCVGE